VAAPRRRVGRSVRRNQSGARHPANASCIRCPGSAHPAHQRRRPGCGQWVEHRLPLRQRRRGQMRPEFPGAIPVAGQGGGGGARSCSRSSPHRLIHVAPPPAGPTCAVDRTAGLRRPAVIHQRRRARTPPRPQTRRSYAREDDLRILRGNAAFGLSGRHHRSSVAAAARSNDQPDPRCQRGLVTRPSPPRVPPATPPATTTPVSRARAHQPHPDDQLSDQRHDPATGNRRRCVSTPRNSPSSSSRDRRVRSRAIIVSTVVQSWFQQDRHRRR